jgi:hypothetical protein
MRWFLVILLVGCGHTMKVGAGPLVTSNGTPGVEGSFEVGKHLISGKQVAMPIGVRFEAAATIDGVQGIVGLAYGANLPPGGRMAKEDDATHTLRGWGGRISFLAAGLAVDAPSGDAALAMRGGLALTRGSMQRGGRSPGGCLGSHEKSRLCYGWQEWEFRQTGIELATMFALVGNDEDNGNLEVRDWRVAAEVFVERGSFSDLD